MPWIWHLLSIWLISRHVPEWHLQMSRHAKQGCMHMPSWVVLPLLRTYWRWLTNIYCSIYTDKHVVVSVIVLSPVPIFLPAQIGGCHITATSEASSRGYSCIVPDNLNPNYDVHILSVYEATSSRAFRQHPTGTSYVSLVVSGEVVKPIILVLVSYEPIEWRLSVPSGVEIERVLLVSFNAT